MEAADSKQMFLLFICLEIVMVLSSAAMTPGNVDRSSNAVDEAEEADNKMSVEERFNHIPPRVLSTMIRLTERAPGMSKNVDTIRAYTPTTHRMCGDHMVSSFNVRLYPYSEALRALELHYYKMRSLRNRGENFQAVLWALSPNQDTECVRLGTLNLHTSRHGYQTTDITAEMTEQWDSLPEEIRIGISFSTSNNNNEDTPQSRSEAAVNTLSTRPFILIYTKQKHRTNIDTLQKTLQKSVNARERRSVIPELEQDDDDDQEQYIADEQQELAKRSSLDPDQLTFAYFSDQSKQRRKMIKQQRKKQKQKRPKNEDESDELTANEITNNEIPLPISERKCRRYPLQVNFRDLGWSDFVIVPREFNAYYCAGTCSKPTKHNISPNNHAAILNIMNTLGASSVPLPAPCCVPDKMTSLNVLFFQEDGRVELQTFSNMQVESCSCR
ncbi:uncharacterized protein [Apostichopus japonicus]|uniref:uncharacterized protein n=1 Tax=Stichopus japonicus TaxID=307972 RepID=UPI003AB3D70F